MENCILSHSPGDYVDCIDEITGRSKVSVINPNISTTHSFSHNIKSNLVDTNASKNNNNKPLTRLVRIIKGSSRRRKIDVDKK